ncbi:MAG TPA: T9SS type A sorting domain-containing protein [Cyclobacteriaceae bacterium]|nr:T9SS type A sorting domain-containing protein [Cyclobacteriaceae bacterium]
MSFTMPSGGSVAFSIEAKNSSNQVLEVRNVSYYNFGSLAAFPNPASSTFKIDVLENEELEIIAFREGNNKAESEFRYCSKESVDVSQWERGTYILHIYHRNKLVKIERLIVQ